LYVSGRTGTIADLDEEFQGETLALADFALQDVMGVSMAGELPKGTVYLKGTEASDIFSESDLKYPLGAAGPALRIKAHEGTKVLATATMSVSEHENNRTFISAISDPPWIETDAPVLTEHAYGEGTCMYCPVLLENEKTEVLREFWGALIERLLEDRRTFRIQAPSCVEASIKKVEQNVCVSLLNTLAHETMAPAGPTKIWISRGLKEVHEVSVYPEGQVCVEKESDGVVVTASELPEFSIVTIS